MNVLGLAVAGVFLLVLGIIVGAYWLLVVSAERRESGAVRRRLKTSRPRISKADIGKSIEPLSTVGALDTVLQRWTRVSEPLKTMLERSGLHLTVGALVLLSVFAAIVVFVALSLVSSSVLLAIVAAAAAGSLPILYVRRMARQRIALFEEQFPEAVDLIARALRAGHALPTALQLTSEEVPDPVGAEFRLLFEQQNYGLSMGEALRAFGERVPLLDARFFVTALQTQREMGGNLSEVLDRLAAVIRERFKVKRQVRSLSAHGRITGVVLGSLPPVVAAVLFVLSPEHIRLLIDDPLGVYMVSAGLFLQVVGVLIIRRIVDVEF
jgi:tight adherence protein B